MPGGQIIALIGAAIGLATLIIKWISRKPPPTKQERAREVQGRARSHATRHKLSILEDNIERLNSDYDRLRDDLNTLRVLKKSSSTGRNGV